MKMDILESMDKHLITKCELAKLFNIPKNTLFVIIKNRDVIMKAMVSIPPNRLLNKEGKYPILEMIVVEWIKNMPIECIKG